MWRRKVIFSLNHGTHEGRTRKCESRFKYAVRGGRWNVRTQSGISNSVALKRTQKLGEKQRGKKQKRRKENTNERIKESKRQNKRKLIMQERSYVRKKGTTKERKINKRKIQM